MITQNQLKLAKQNADILLMVLVEVSAFFEDSTMNKEQAVGTQELVTKVVNYVATGQGNIKDIQALLRG